LITKLILLQFDDRFKLNLIIYSYHIHSSNIRSLLSGILTELSSDDLNVTLMRLLNNELLL